MKKLQTIFLSTLALFAVSCSSDTENEEVIDTANKPVVLRATIEGTKTRTAIDNGKVNWLADDAISVRLSDGSNLKMTVKEGAGKAEATFAGTIYGNATISTPTVAIYPYDKDHVLAGSLAVNMPAEYTVADNTNTNMPMLCEFDENGEGQFKHLGGVMQFTVGLEYILAANKEPKQFRFTTLDKQNITGNFEVVEEDGNKVIKATPYDNENLNNSVTITFNADQIVTVERNGTVCKELTVNVPMPVGTYVGIALDILDADGNKLVETFGANAATNTVARSKRVVMPKATPAELTAGTEDPDPEIPDNGIPVDNTDTEFDGSQSGDKSND